MHIISSELTATLVYRCFLKIIVHLYFQISSQDLINKIVYIILL